MCFVTLFVWKDMHQDLCLLQVYYNTQVHTCLFHICKTSKRFGRPTDIYSKRKIEKKVELTCCNSSKIKNIAKEGEMWTLRSLSYYAAGKHLNPLGFSPWHKIIFTSLIEV